MTLLDSGELGSDEIGAAPYERLAVLGAGAWGTALALTAARAGCQARLWSRRAEIAEAIRTAGRNPAYLSNVDLAARDLAGSIRAEADLRAAIDGAEAVLLAAPSSAIRPISEILAAALRDRPEPTPVVLCAKGVESGSGMLMSDIVAQALRGSARPHPIAALSGPTFAAEVGAGLPTAVTIRPKSTSRRNSGWRPASPHGSP